MSAHLGKIHYWLYNQIQIIDDRNNFLVKNYPKISNQYKESLSNRDIEEALGDQHIHPGLESLIIKVQTEEYSIVNDLIKTTDFDEIKGLYYSHGIETAKDQNCSAETINEIIEALKDILLERMPCDRLTQIDINENCGKLIRDSKLHTEFWFDLEVSVEQMHQLYSAWIKGALHIINPKVQYEREIKSDHYIDQINFIE